MTARDRLMKGERARGDVWSRPEPTFVESEAKLQAQPSGVVAPPSAAPIDPKAAYELFGHYADRLTDPMLVSETSELRFPKTVVGESSRRAIVVRNDDTRPLSLDAVVPVRTAAAPRPPADTAVRLPTGHADVFHEVEALLDGTLLLAPGERRAITIQFRPARAARVEQTLQLISGLGPVGPAADIRVCGEGVDLPHSGSRVAEQPESTTSSAMATEVRIDEQKREVAGLARTHDALAKQRARATQLVDRWRASAGRYTHSLAQWTLSNWIDFLGKTGGDHVLYGSAAVVDGWKKLVATKLAGTALKKGSGAALALAKRSAQVALVMEYPLFGKAIELAIERLSGFILDKIGLKEESPQGKSDRHALEATRSTGEAGVHKTHEILGYEARANLAIEDTASGAQLQIARAETAEELVQWESWAQAELANLPPLVEPGGREFSDALLQRWVLEHAGTTETPNASTNSKAWKAARAELKDKGQLDSLDRADLFVHQCRHEWGYLGLIGAEQVVAQLDAEQRSAPSARARFVSFRGVKDPQHLMNVFGKKNVPMQDFGFGAEPTVDCNVVLGETKDGGFFVRRFTYSVRGANGYRYADMLRKPGAP